MPADLYSIFLAPYWPTPEAPPQIRVMLEVERRNGGKGIVIRGEVTSDSTTPLWAFSKVDERISDPSGDEAKITALYAMVDHLAQCLADARGQLAKLSEKNGGSR